MKIHFTLSRFFLYSLFVIFIISCATPKAIIRMNPVSQDVTWNYGQSYASDTVNGVVIEAAFDEATDGYNIFDISVVNQSNLDYLVEPEEFVMEEVVSDSSIAGSYTAINPEVMLLKIDKDISQSEADAKNAKIGAAIATGALVATAAVLAVGTDNDAYVEDNRRYADPDLFVDIPLIINVVSDDYNYNSVVPLGDDRDFWKGYTLRKTTLKSGYKVSGKLLFPRFEKPGVYILKVRVDNQFIEIPFVQLNYFPE